MVTIVAQTTGEPAPLECATYIGADLVNFAKRVRMNPWSLS